MPEASASSRILTLVFTDLVESTALKATQGDAPAAELIARHRSHLVRIAEEHTGRIVDFAGDGCFLSFEAPSAAVLFALELQHAHALEPELPRVRIGVHLGEVTERLGKDARRLEGLAVDLAARVQSAARPGQILVSATVASSARPRLGAELLGRALRWLPHGAYALKGASEPLDILEVGLLGIAPFAAPEGGVKAHLVTKPSARRRTLFAAFGVPVVVAGAVLLWLSVRDSGNSSVVPGAELASSYSLAVLPLANLSGDPEQAYFADGMTDLMITHLARSPRLRVTSRTSTLRYVGGQKPISEIARELHVDLVVEGTVLREGQRVRITVQLIRAQTDEHVWANSFERDFGGVLELQREVAQAVADEIGIELAPWRSASAANPRAQEDYLHGIYAYGMGDMMGSAEALERAVTLDPDHALAFAALARSYYFIAFFGDLPPADAFQRMEAAATKALEKDPTLASAHGSLALVKLHRDWNWDDAEQHFRRAIELNPSNADVHHDYAHFLLVMRRDSESLAETQRAVALDPFNPMLNACLGWHSLFSGRYDQAIDVARRTLQIQPTNFWARVNLGWAYEQKAMYAEAASEFKQASEQKPMSMDMPMEPMWPPMQMSAEADRIKATRADLVVLAAASLGHALGLAGDRPGARALLDQLLRQREHAYVSPYDIALLYTGLGENDDALDWLQRAYQERSALLVFALREPRLAPLRGEPRFAKLAREFALPP